MSRNAAVAAMLWDLSEALRLRNDAFRAQAYQRAAQTVESLARPIEAVSAAGGLQDLPGIGAGIAGKIEEFLRTGQSSRLQRLRAEMPAGVTQLMAVPGLGPRRAMQLAKELGIRDVKGLAKAIEQGKVRGLKGFGEKRSRQILDAISQAAAAGRRIPFGEAEGAGERLLAYLKEASEVQTLELAGSLRRGRDTVGDLDIVAGASGRKATGLIQAFVAYPGAVAVIEKGSTRARIRLRGGMGADLRVLPTASMGAALVYFTGSKEHNIQLRQLALKRGWSLNESSLHTKGRGKAIASRTEQEVYAALGLTWVPPELREGRGEVDLARDGRLPELVERKDLRGDLHVHTDASDGRHSLQAMVAAAGKLGYTYLGVSDHGETLPIANGLTGKRYAAQRREIDLLQRKTPTLRILQGAELDILKDGRLGLDTGSQAKLDYIVGSVHGAFRLPAAEQTRRLVAAISNGIDILGHPSGRMFPRRAGIEADWEKVYQAAKDGGVLLEVDGTPDRLDLPGEQVRIAREIGCRFTIDSDAHATGELEQIRFGLTQARRGGLEAKLVANAWPMARLESRFGHAKRR